MSAKVIKLDSYRRARTIALLKARRVFDIAEELATMPAGPARDKYCRCYVRFGWASHDEIRLAMEVLGE